MHEQGTQLRAHELSNEDEAIDVAAFRVGSEEYLLDLHRVREIIVPVPITPVRKAPTYVEGVIDLRGSIIPIVDLRKRFELDVRAQSAATRILIVVVNGRLVGLIVDAATDVLRLERKKIKSAPAMLRGDQAPFFLGVYNHNGRLMTLMNIKKVLGSDDPIPLVNTMSGVPEGDDA